MRSLDILVRLWLLSHGRLFLLFPLRSGSHLPLLPRRADNRVVTLTELPNSAEMVFHPLAHRLSTTRLGCCRC